MLTEQNIDKVLLSNVTEQWRKVAMVVGETLLQVPGMADTFLANRINLLVKTGALEAQGDLKQMRSSEVRLPQRRVDA